jgi:hypothetical protein
MFAFCITIATNIITFKNLLDNERSFSGDRQKVYNYSFYGIWKKLLLVFAKGESVAFFLHPSIVPVLSNIVHNKVSATVEDLFQFAHKCPVLCNLIAALPDHKIPDFAFGMFDKVLAICAKSYPWLYTFDESKSDSMPSIILQEAPSTTSTSRVHLEGFAKSVCTEPIIPEPLPEVSGCNWLWPKIRTSKVYTPYIRSETANSQTLQSVIDNSTHQWNDAFVPDVYEDVDSAADAEECKKVENTKYKEKDQTAGLLVTCCTHTFCYGWHCMFGPEGRKDVMKVLYKRMPQTVLDNLIVIYDFACQAAEYCIKREPKMFSKTQFFIDRFHATNHKCASFWKLTSYPGFAELASTASESLNAFLQRFHSQCAFMRQDTYMLFLEVVITVRNWLINERLKGNMLQATQ